jgi:hypothetical protein
MDPFELLVDSLWETFDDTAAYNFAFSGASQDFQHGFADIALLHRYPPSAI